MNTKHKVTNRIIFLIIVFVLPINILSLIFSWRNYENTKTAAKREIDNSLEVVATSLNMDLTNERKALLYGALSDPGLIELANLSDEDISKRYDYTIRGKKELSRIAEVQTSSDVLFYYFPQNEIALIEDSVIANSSYLIPEIKEAYQYHSENNLKQRWEICDCAGVSVLMYTASRKNIFYGILFPINSSAYKLPIDNEQENRVYFLGNEDGTVLSRNAEVFLDNNEISFEEAKNSSRFFVTREQIGSTGLYLYALVDAAEITGATISVVWRIIFIFALFTLLAIPILILQMRKWVIKPLNALNSAMDHVENGDTEYRIKDVANSDEFSHLNSSFNEMMNQLTELRIDAYENEIEKRNIRLDYLSQQVQPHFILNALNILYSYEPEEYEHSQRMILCISKYFRHIVYANDKFVSLKSEMEHLQNYFEIQKARFPELFYSIVEYDEELAEALVPPLLIQTFAENAIKHSLSVGNRITIFLIAERYEEAGESFVRIRLADTGVGVSDQVLAEIRDFEETGRNQEHLGVGIQNSIERLKVVYEGRAKIQIGRDEIYPGTNVEIILPLHFRGEGESIDETSFDR